MNRSRERKKVRVELKRACPVCGFETEDMNFYSHTHYIGDKPYVVPFVSVLDKQGKITEWKRERG
jgi:hypothetical protein